MALLIVFLVVAAGVYFLVAKGVIKNPLTSKQKATVSLQTRYDNPFDKNTQYANPFSQYKNPFDTAK